MIGTGFKNYTEVRFTDFCAYGNGFPLIWITDYDVRSICTIWRKEYRKVRSSSFRRRKKSYFSST
jgi:hypothetical protein